MKKKYAYRILLILTVVAISFFLNYQFGLFSRYNPISAQTDIIQGKIQIVVFGEMDLKDPIREQISKFYGFEYVFLGCAVSSSINGIEYYNRAMASFISQQHGVNWEQKLEKQVDSLAKMQPK